MISEITITLNDDGFWVVSVGEALLVQSRDRRDVLALVNESLSKLAYFPTHQNALHANPIPYEDFKKNKPKKKNERNNMAKDV